MGAGRWFKAKGAGIAAVYVVRNPSLFCPQLIIYVFSAILWVERGGIMLPYTIEEITWRVTPVAKKYKLVANKRNAKCCRP